MIHSFDIGTVIMPDVSHTTQTYEDVLDALLEKNLTVTAPHPGDSYSIGDASLDVYKRQVQRNHLERQPVR